MKSSVKAVRRSVTLPAKAEAEKRKQQEFFELAERCRNATDPMEAQRLGDALGRMVFGEQTRSPCI